MSVYTKRRFIDLESVLFISELGFILCEEIFSHHRQPFLALSAILEVYWYIS